jgi:hypothetical protein
MTPDEAYKIAKPIQLANEAASDALLASENLAIKIAETQAKRGETLRNQKAANLYIAKIDDMIPRYAARGAMSANHLLHEGEHLHSSDPNTLGPVDKIVFDYFKAVGFTVTIGYTEHENKLSGNDPDYGSGTITSRKYDKLKISWAK